MLFPSVNFFTACFIGEGELGWISSNQTFDIEDIHGQVTNETNKEHINTKILELKHFWIILPNQSI